MNATSEITVTLLNYPIRCSYRSADKMFADNAVWRSVNERDKKEIYEDVVFYLAKKEKVINFIANFFADPLWIAAKAGGHVWRLGATWYLRQVFYSWPKCWNKPKMHSHYIWRFHTFPFSRYCSSKLALF